MSPHDKHLLSLSKILIIDDDAFARMVLRQVFVDKGFTNIEEAANGQEGLEKTIANSPDIVFLDIEMPVMNGFEYCKKIRQNKNFENLVILVQTGLSSVEEKKKIFASGATDYVNKPIDPDEIFARSLVHLKNSVYLKELESFKNRMSLEIQSAKRLIDISLPSEKKIKEIMQDSGVMVVSHFQSSSEIGGDFWHVDKIDKNKISIYIVDFSGHGVDAALNAARLDSIIKSSEEKNTDPASLLKWLNKNLVSLLPPEQYATVFYGVIDIINDTLTYSAAACPPMLVIRGGEEHYYLDGSGYPLGVSIEAVYENQTIPFTKHDLLLLYSDAIIETPDSKGEFLPDFYGAFIKNYKGLQASALRGCFDLFIYNFLNDYGDNMADDLTLIMCSRP